MVFQIEFGIQHSLSGEFSLALLRGWPTKNLLPKMPADANRLSCSLLQIGRVTSSGEFDRKIRISRQIQPPYHRVHANTNAISNYRAADRAVQSIA